MNSFDEDFRLPKTAHERREKRKLYSTNPIAYLVALICTMKKLLRIPALGLLTTLFFTSCENRETNSSPEAATSTTGPSNNVILSSLYGKSAGDSAVYVNAKLTGEIKQERPVIANVIANQVFTRHDSVFSLVFTKNQFDWGGVANTGWIDGALFYQAGEKWRLLRHKPQLLWGGTDGQCDCQSTIVTIATPQGEKAMAFIKVYSSHQGEYQAVDVVTDKLVAGNNPIITYETDGMCAYYVDVDTLKTGMIVKNTPGKPMTFDLVSFETTRKAISEDSVQCSGKYQHREFTYEQLIKAMQEPKAVE